MSFKAKRSRSSTQLLLCLIEVVSKRWWSGWCMLNHKICRFCFFLVYLLHNVVHGSQATPVYTLMLRCSQNAPPSIRTACYSFLGTLEILGKQLSLFMAGVLTESFGCVTALNISLVVSFFVVILVWHCPKHLRWSYKDLQYVWVKIWLDIGQVLSLHVEVHKLAKKCGQYPVILTEQTWSIEDLLYSFRGNLACGYSG